ncbi:MAG: MoaF N-terminal domain-containing protein [Acidobacteria bacterium]|nr:MoaF N-terminal domain-containing protein [Acidobacteriota bacterium]
MPAPYPKQQMHRIRYTRLTPESIQQKLAAASAGPIEHPPLSAALAGQSLRIVTSSLALEYRFNSPTELVLREDNQEPVKAGYGALELNHVVFFSHMLPGTQRGLNVILDRRSHLATVFEVWFSGYTDNREAQRLIHYGYIDRPGVPPPTARHHITNRLEGKGFYWKQDNGVESLEFYPSVLSSSFVELTRTGGELTFCAPSDFIQIDDSTYIYSRVECEFSGTLTLYVLDLFTVAQVGVRLGFNENDALEYTLFRGKGEITGQLATFEKFGDKGENIGAGRPAPKRKGERMVYRPLLQHPPMTPEEVVAAAKKKTILFNPEEAMAGNRPPLATALVGKQFTLRYDHGPAWEYRFDEARKLRWRKSGETAWREEVYEAYEAADNLFVFGHLRTGTQPQESAIVVLDLTNTLTTCVDAHMGTEYMGNEVTQNIIFGVIEAPGLIAPRYHRHKFTDELVGHAVTWNYSGGLTSMHVYSSPRSSSWTIFLPDGAGGLQWSSPCNYVKLRDDCYLFSWIEEACNGSQGTIVYNTRTMHDVGFGFYVDHTHLSFNVIGAHARNAGRYDVKKYYGPKA